MAKSNKTIKIRQRTKPISYHAKDVFSKVMAELFKGNSFAPFGVQLPKIISAEPTNLPAIEANELRMDNLFLLEDGSYAIIDYESTYSEKNKLKYLGYLARVAKRLYNELGFMPRIRIVILYTADVRRGETNPTIDLGCSVTVLEEGFLSEMDRDALWKHSLKRVAEGMPLEEETMMRLMVYPLSFREKADKQDAVLRVMNLADEMSDEKQTALILTGMMVFGDKVIRPKDADEIRRRIMLTKVEKIIAREMQEAVDAAVEKNTAEVTEDVTAKVEQRIVENFLKSGATAESVAAITEVPIETVRKLQAAMA